MSNHGLLLVGASALALALAIKMARCSLIVDSLAPAAFTVPTRQADAP
jgi:hypothetical protein